MIAYNDDFKLMMVLTLCAVPLVLLLRRGARSEGRRTGGDRMNASHVHFAAAADGRFASRSLAGCAVGPDFHAGRSRPPPIATRPSRLQLEAAATPRAAASRSTSRSARSSGPRAGGSASARPTLDDVVQRALAGNRTLVAAAATLAQAQELAAAQARHAGAAGRPQRRHRPAEVRRGIPRHAAEAAALHLLRGRPERQLHARLHRRRQRARSSSSERWPKYQRQQLDGGAAWRSPATR